MFTDNYIRLDTVESTNDYILNLPKQFLKEGLVVNTNFQTYGKGQLNNKWESDSNMNLLSSVVIEPNIIIDNQFHISMIVSLAICDLLYYFGIKSQIKWPNDILVYDKKISGILIINKVKNNLLTHSIIGVGLNINQIKFSKFNTKATSISLLLNRNYSIRFIEKLYLNFLSKRLKLYRGGDFFDDEYLDLMYLKDKKSFFEHNGIKFRATIRGFNKDGSIILENEDNSNSLFKIKEIKYLS